ATTPPIQAPTKPGGKRKSRGPETGNLEGSELLFGRWSTHYPLHKKREYRRLAQDTGRGSTRGTLVGILIRQSHFQHDIGVTN
ncbi:hypothetical protein M9458_008711, partial [Cirrhinus mrigala]